MKHRSLGAFGWPYDKKLLPGVRGERLAVLATLLLVTLSVVAAKYFEDPQWVARVGGLMVIATLLFTRTAQVDDDALRAWMKEVLESAEVDIRIAGEVAVMGGERDASRSSVEAPLPIETMHLLSQVTDSKIQEVYSFADHEERMERLTRNYGMRGWLLSELNNRMRALETTMAMIGLFLTQFGDLVFVRILG